MVGSGWKAQSSREADFISRSRGTPVRLPFRKRTASCASSSQESLAALVIRLCHRFVILYSLADLVFERSVGEGPVDLSVLFMAQALKILTQPLQLLNERVQQRESGLSVTAGLG
jgi:hypothetical protein